MFHEDDILVYHELARDRRRRREREQDRPLAAGHREEQAKQTQNRRQKTGLRLLVERLLPAR